MGYPVGVLVPFSGSVRVQMYTDPMACNRWYQFWVAIYHRSLEPGELVQEVQYRRQIPWWLSVINLGGAGHLSPSINLPFFPYLSWTLQGVRAEPAQPPRPNISDAVYTVKQPYKIHIDVCITRYRNQLTCRVWPLSAELILWLTGHV